MTDFTQDRARREPALASLPSSDIDAEARDRSGGHAIARSRAPWIIAIGAVAIGVAALIAWRLRPAPPPAPAPAAEAAPASATAARPDAAPAIRYPIDAAAAADAPPPGDAPAPDDAALLASLLALPGAAGLDRLLVTDDLARRFVATIDNLPRASVASRVMAVHPAQGAFAVDADDGRTTIGRGNAARYAPYVKSLRAVDTRQLVALYVRNYPTFQTAYRDLGYPSGYFNDRLVDVIDHLLATPDVTPPVALVQPRVLYEYANPDLEARSAGQKALLRLGPDDESAVKAKLRDIRRALTAAPARP